MDLVLRGEFSSQLPQQDTNLVRIFLSSTFGGMLQPVATAIDVN